MKIKNDLIGPLILAIVFFVSMVGIGIVAKNSIEENYSKTEGKKK